MKETTGELNSAVVVMLAVGVLIAFFYYTLWPLLRNNFNKNSQCSKAICEQCRDASGNISNKCERVVCHLEGSSETFECVYKG